MRRLLGGRWGVCIRSEVRCWEIVRFGRLETVGGGRGGEVVLW